jgi:hypothetical protein
MTTSATAIPTYINTTTEQQIADLARRERVAWERAASRWYAFADKLSEIDMPEARAHAERAAAEGHCCEANALSVERERVEREHEQANAPDPVAELLQALTAIINRQ